MALKLIPPGARGNTNFLIRGRVNGRLYEYSAATTDPLAARRKLKALADKLAAEGNPNRITFAQAAQRYIEFRNPSRVDRQRLEKVVNAIGSRRLRELTALDLHECANRLGAGMAGATRNRNYLRPATTVLHYAASTGLCSYLRVQAFKEGRPKTRAVDREAALALIAAAAPGPQRLLVTWLFCQGTRISDTLRVRWEDIDLDQGTVKIHVSKTDTVRTFPLHTDVCRELVAGMPDVPSGFVFPWRTRSGVRWLRELAASLGFHFTAHMARHSLGTWLNEDGAGLRTIMEALGHADVHSSIRYQGANVEIVRAAINKVDLRRKA